ncbi:unnamed protein product [Prunus brigantina]
MIYGVNEAITGMVLRCLEKSRVLSIYRRSPGGTIEAEKTCMVESDWGKWVVQSAFGIVKHGGSLPFCHRALNASYNQWVCCSSQRHYFIKWGVGP